MIEKEQLVIREDCFYKGTFIADSKKKVSEYGFVKVPLLRGQYQKVYVTGVADINRAYHNNQVIIQVKKQRKGDEQETRRDGKVVSVLQNDWAT